MFGDFRAKRLEIENINCSTGNKELVKKSTDAFQFLSQF